MNVPSFSDLGANARDVFTTGYHYGKGLIKLGATARSLGKLKMGSNIQLETETSKMIGNVYAVYKTHNYGSFVQKWVEDGTITLGFRETVMPDVSTKSDISYNPGTAAKKVEVGAKCNKETINAICLVSSDVTSYVNILGSIVTAVKGLLIGYQGGYNSQTKRMTNDVGVAFSYQDVGFHFRCTSIPYEYGLSLLYKVLAAADLVTCVMLLFSGLARGVFWCENGWLQFDVFVYLPVVSASSNLAVWATMCVAVDRLAIVFRLYNLQNWLQFVMFGMIPAVLLVVTNMIMCQSVKKTLRKKQLVLQYKNIREGNRLRVRSSENDCNADWYRVRVCPRRGANSFGIATWRTVASLWGRLDKGVGVLHGKVSVAFEYHLKIM
ncbi:Voltage-dependent anion-selective channel protein 1 [Eufriesea mexicana]|nr:Voltage-dependent anion-selective channel protein 1 [Eufriesea mexicana]